MQFRIPLTSFDFIKEVQVKTAGYSAEFGQSTGGVITAVTQSGSNRVRGSGFGYWEPDALEGSYRQVVLPNATRTGEAVNTTRTLFSDVGLQTGGPILRDQLFFFGAFDRQWNTTTLIAPENFPLRSLGEVDRERKAWAYSGKATFQMAPSHRFDFSMFGDPSEGELGPQRRSALLRTDQTAFSRINYGGHNQTLRYESIVSPRFLVSASIAHSSNLIEEFPQDDSWAVRDARVEPNELTGGIGFYEVGNDGSNLQYQAKATYLAGNHEIRGGFLFENINYDNTIDRTGPSFVLPDGTRTATGAAVTILPDPDFGEIYRVTRANISNVRGTSQNYVAMFLQDKWEVGDRPDDPAGDPLRAAEVDWQPGRLLLDWQLGAPARRDLGSHG